MINCIDVISAIETLAPLHLACEWDNSGLLVGDVNKGIRRLLICLDVDEYVVKEAIDIGADMIISHHPVMFTPVNRLTENAPHERLLRMLCKSDICLYSAHTNMDCAPGGLNDYLAGKIGINNPKVLEETVDGAGFGRYGRIKDVTTLEEALKICAKALKLTDLRYVGDLDREIVTVAVNSGSGSDILGKCMEEGVDLLITGDLKYTPARSAYENGVAVIDATHYGTEIIFTELVENYLKSVFDGLEIATSKANRNVLKTYIDKQESK